MTENTLLPLAVVDKEKRVTRRTVLRWTALIILSIWLVIPFVPMLIWSFSYRWTFPDLLPESWSLKGWEYVISPTSQVIPAILDSAFIAICVTCLGRSRAG